MKTFQEQLSEIARDVTAEVEALDRTIETTEARRYRNGFELALRADDEAGRALPFSEARIRSMRRGFDQLEEELGQASERRTAPDDATEIDDALVEGFKAFGLAGVGAEAAVRSLGRSQRLREVPRRSQASGTGEGSESTQAAGSGESAVLIEGDNPRPLLVNGWTADGRLVGARR